MKRFGILCILCVAGLFQGLIAQTSYSVKIAKLQYSGGGDWYANPTSVPNLINYVQSNTNIQVDPQEYVVEAAGTQIFQYPIVYMTGHGNVLFSDEEARNLRTYLISGGFLHVDDNYGLDKFIRREMKKVFPDIDFVELPYDHPIFHQQFDFTEGLPKIHEHDGERPQGFGLFYEGRLVCFYSYESDLGDGWEDHGVHGDSEEIREQALKMGTNIVIYALNN